MHMFLIYTVAWYIRLVSFVTVFCILVIDIVWIMISITCIIWLLDNILNFHVHLNRCFNTTNFLLNYHVLNNNWPLEGWLSHVKNWLNDAQNVACLLEVRVLYPRQRFMLCVWAFQCSLLILITILNLPCFFFPYSFSTTQVSSLLPLEFFFPSLFSVQCWLCAFFFHSVNYLNYESIIGIRNRMCKC